MGAVRFALVILGASIMEWNFGGESSPWLAATAVGGYVGFLTYFSVEEETMRAPVLQLRARLVKGWLFVVLVGLFFFPRPQWVVGSGMDRARRLAGALCSPSDPDDATPPPSHDASTPHGAVPP